MAVKLRLARRGRKKLAIYDLVVADARAPRDGRFIEKLGTYNPNTHPSSVEINDDKAVDWLIKGAQPTQTVRNILSDRGVMLRKHLQIGVIKGALSQEQAEQKFLAWKSEKEQKLAKELDEIASSKAAKAKQKLEAEAKVKEKRAEALRKKQAELAGTPAPAEPAEDAADSAPESGEKPEATAPEAQPEAKDTVEGSVAEEKVAPESGEKPEAIGTQETEAAPETKEEPAKAEETQSEAKEEVPGDVKSAPESGDKPEAEEPAKPEEAAGKDAADSAPEKGEKEETSGDAEEPKDKKEE